MDPVVDAIVNYIVKLFIDLEPVFVIAGAVTLGKKLVDTVVGAFKGVK